MDVWRITVAVLRRWYVFLPLMALTALGVMEVGEGVDPQYEVTATAILVPGTATSNIENPYGGIDETNQVLSIVLDSPESRQQIEVQGLVSDYELSARSRSRIMDFMVVGDSPEESLATADAVIELGRLELAERQGAVSIPEDAQVGLQILQAPSVSEVVTEGRARSMAIVGLLGASLAVLVSVLFDDLVGLLKRWLAAWRGRRAERQGPVGESGAHPETPPETVAQTEPDVSDAASLAHTGDRDS